jgi:hypothetical protein
MTAKNRELVKLKVGEKKSISVPRFLKDHETVKSSCPGEATITLEGAPDFMKVADSKVDDEGRPV